MITKLLFLLSESFRALFRAKLPAAISSITIAIALVIFSLAYFSYVNLLGYSYKFKSKYRIEVFFHNDLATDDARELFNTILISDGIEQGEFIDKEKASELFKSYFHEDINEIIGENPLPMGGRYDIATDYRNSNKMRRIVREIRRLEGVDVASFQQGIISRVDSIVENILGISMVFGIAIFIIAVILVSNTIRLIIHAKQETIETMHLLGATNSFIRFPFVVEGIIQGVLGAGFSLLILYLLRSLQAYLLEPLVNIPLMEPANLIAYNFIFGLLLALIGSYRGISKYLPK
ncbi:MAG: permease-like cell division protein FtsX [Candidatus Marinimicrobia bacterium]|jgi:cell division transport system permease protein|nr:permease-like cell division protein FtsX [Candidatus Neomarinimicrobiota bacterium]